MGESFDPSGVIVNILYKDKISENIITYSYDFEYLLDYCEMYGEVTFYMDTIIGKELFIDIIVSILQILDILINGYNLIIDLLNNTYLLSNIEIKIIVYSIKSNILDIFDVLSIEVMEKYYSLFSKLVLLVSSIDNYFNLVFYVDEEKFYTHYLLLKCSMFNMLNAINDEMIDAIYNSIKLINIDIVYVFVLATAKLVDAGLSDSNGYTYELLKQELLYNYELFENLELFGDYSAFANYIDIVIINISRLLILSFVEVSKYPLKERNSIILFYVMLFGFEEIFEYFNPS